MAAPPTEPAEEEGPPAEEIAEAPEYEKVAAAERAEEAPAE
jgi:hypothetical protein